MRPYLLDVNVLLALCDNHHIHHEAAHTWFERKGHKAWATSPITENGFIRIASNPQYTNPVGDVFAAMEILKQLCQLPGYHFWSEDLHLWEILEAGKFISHSQVTDIYLLSLAVKKQGRLATLDKRIVTGTVKGGNEALELIEPI